MGASTILAIIILIILGILILLNWNCISQGLNQKQMTLCIRKDFGLGDLGIGTKDFECNCLSSSTE